uniref:Uncharacterized protein n=2 Tax=Oryza TaxID=4527 RepID=A0A0E0I3I4_ORYNI
MNPKKKNEEGLGGSAARDFLFLEIPGQGGGETLGFQGDLGAVLGGQIGLNRNGFRLSRKHSMKQPPTAAASAHPGPIHAKPLSPNTRAAAAAEEETTRTTGGRGENLRPSPPRAATGERRY